MKNKNRSDLVVNVSRETFTIGNPCNKQCHCSHKIWIAMVVLLCILSIFVACANEQNLFEIHSREGIAPYVLSDKEKYILQTFGMDSTSQIITFQAPKEAIILDVKVYY